MEKNKAQQPRQFIKQHRLLFVVGIVVLPLLLFHGLGLEKASMAALFVSVVLLWFTELIPLALTGLLVPCLAVAYGISDTKSAFSAFGNQILFLFIGAFLLGKAIQKHGWDRRVSYWVLSGRHGSKTPAHLSVVIAAICWLLSMWISNTAACVIAVPIVLGILETLRDNFQSEENFRRFRVRLLLICAFASSIGGLATPVGTPPNLLAMQFLSEQGINLNFFQWMIIGLPVSFLMLLALLVILSVRFPAEKVNLTAVRADFEKKSAELGKISRAEKQVALCFLLAIVLWIAPGVLKMVFPDVVMFSTLSSKLPMGAVAIFAAALLFCLSVDSEGEEKNLTWNDAKNIDWGTILLFGGGLCLGSLLSNTGLAQDIGGHLFSSDTQSLLLTGFITVAVAILLSEFSSNTASTAIILPIVIASFATQGDVVLTQLVIATAFGASYGFMLPVSTPPNAIVYGTEKVPLQQMTRTGVIFDITGLIIICLLLLVLFPAVGLIESLL